MGARPVLFAYLFADKRIIGKKPRKSPELFENSGLLCHNKPKGFYGYLTVKENLKCVLFEG